MSKMHEWETVDYRGAGQSVERFRVPGGWVYLFDLIGGAQLVYVPDLASWVGNIHIHGLGS